MNNLTKCFINTYDEEMQKIGFMRSGSIFHKLVQNQIVQLLAILKYPYTEYSIQFGFRPLCCGDEIDKHMDDYTISYLANDRVTWDFNENDNTTMKETLDLCKKELFPYFKKINNYISFMDYFPIMFFQMAKVAPPISYDYNFKINLALGNYDLALKSRESLLESYGEISEDNIHWIEKRNEVQKEYKLIKDAIISGDHTYIKNYVKNNEEFSLNSYYKNFKVKNLDSDRSKL